MKSSIELLSVDALAFMGFFLRDCVRQRFGIDEIDVSADPAKITRRTPYGRLQRTIVTAIDVFAEVDVTIRVREFDDTPRRFERPRSPRGHAGQCRGDLRDRSSFRKLALKAHVADLPWAQKTD